MASFLLLLASGKFDKQGYTILHAKVTAFDCKGSMFHMFSELAEEGQLSSLVSK